MCQLVFIVPWDAEEVDSHASEGTGLAIESEGKQAEGQELPSSMSFI